MRTSKRKLNKNRTDGVNFDKKFEQFFEASRQIADGFSGARPGKRKRSNLRDFSRRSARNVGDWVVDKMDSFFEDEYEDWRNDNFDADEKEFKSFRRSNDYEEDFLIQGKRPLEAISLRSKDKIFDKQKKLCPSEDYSGQDWEDDSFFQTNKWQRSPQVKEDFNLSQKSDKQKMSSVRNYPRSRRNRL